MILKNEKGCGWLVEKKWSQVQSVGSRQSFKSETGLQSPKSHRDHIGSVETPCKVSV